MTTPTLPALLLLGSYHMGNFNRDLFRYEPEQRVSYNGETALKVCLTAQNNQAKLIYYLQPETLQILGSVIEG